MFRRRKNKKNDDKKTDKAAADEAKNSAANQKKGVKLENDKSSNGAGKDSDEDPDAALKNISKASTTPVGSPKDLRGSMNRYDEMTSYTNRSERSHLHPDPSPSKEELSKRRVKLHEEVTVHTHTDSMTAEEISNYFMQEEDFRRCDADVELTSFRWDKYVKGKMPFDENENTLRGLEDIIAYDQRREAARAKHVQDVLTEAMKQRTKGKKELDWDKIRLVGEKTSVAAAKRAVEVGAQDEMDATGSGKRLSRRSASFKKKSSNVRDSDNRKSVGKMRMMLSFRNKKS